MSRFGFWLFLLSLALHAELGENGVVWFEHPACGGVLIEPDVVITAASCLRDSTRVVWPSRSEINYSTKHPTADLAVIFLSRTLQDKPLQIIQPSELKFLKKSLLVQFANHERSKQESIDRVNSENIEAFFGLEPVLLGSPMRAYLGPNLGYRVLGIMKDSRTALRLDPFLPFIKQTLLANAEKPITIQAEVVPGKKPIISIEATQTQTEPPATVLGTATPAPTPAPTPIVETPAAQVISKPPESLGCVCAQVRPARSIAPSSSRAKLAP